MVGKKSGLWLRIYMQLPKKANTETYIFSISGLTLKHESYMASCPVLRGVGWIRLIVGFQPLMYTINFYFCKIINNWRKYRTAFGYGV